MSWEKDIEEALDDPLKFAQRKTTEELKRLEQEERKKILIKLTDKAKAKLVKKRLLNS